MRTLKTEFWMTACKKIKNTLKTAITWSRIQMQISWSIIWATFMMLLILVMILNISFGILSIIKFIKTVLIWLENSCPPYLSKMAAKWTDWTRRRRTTTDRMSRTTQSWTRDKCWMIFFLPVVRQMNIEGYSLWKTVIATTNV